MKYNVGDYVKVAVDVSTDGKKRISTTPLQDGHKIEVFEFEVIMVDGKNQLYKILVDNDICGWWVNGFHIENEKIDPRYLNKKFFDIQESFILNDLI